jgi:DNA polymerase-1
MLDQLPFARIVICDTEFQPRPGNLVLPVCLVAKELRSGQTWRLWMDEFGSSPPYPIDRGTLFVAFSVPAELSVSRANGWRDPARTLDLFAERRVAVNGLPWHDGAWSLIGAMTDHGLDPGPAAIKDVMRDRVMAGPPFTHNERHEILEYCERDLDGTAQLLVRMLPQILARPHGLVHALNRGSYGIAVAAMEATGVSIDTGTLGRLLPNWETIKDQLVADGDREYGVFDGHEIDRKRFAAFITRHRIAWPRTEKTGALSLDKDTFKDMARGKHHQLLNPLKELLVTLGQLRLNDLQVGPDGRNRCSLKPFWSKTGRNQPSSSQYIFGNATWYRGLIQAPPGRAILYLDWRCQEIGIEAACSQDPAMLEALRTDDFYIAFGKRAGVLPDDATEKTHGTERAGLKTVALGVGYGMQEHSLAVRLAKTCPEARELLRLHRRTFPRFWAWNDDVVHFAKLNGKLWTTYGWQLAVTEPLYEAGGRQIGGTKVRTLRNYLMQGNAAEMLRIACYRFVAKGGLDKGFLLCGPVHDALLVECSSKDVAEAAQFTAEIMEEASRAVLGGFTLGIDVKVWRHPDRFMDEKRGRATWNRIMGHLARAEASTKHAPQVSHFDDGVSTKRCTRAISFTYPLPISPDG